MIDLNKVCSSHTFLLVIILQIDLWQKATIEKARKIF